MQIGVRNGTQCQSEGLTGGGGGLTAMSRRGTCLSALMPQRGDAALDRTEHDRRTSAKQNQVASAHPESTLKKMETKHVPVIRPPMAKNQPHPRCSVSVLAINAVDPPTDTPPRRLASVRM